MVIWLLTWSSGGSWASLQNALERAAETVTEGGNVQSAVSGFCTEILHGA